MAPGALSPLTIFRSWYDKNMNMWEVEYTDEFEEWWNPLSVAEHEAINYTVNLLRQFGPNANAEVSVTS